MTARKIRIVLSGPGLIGKRHIALVRRNNQTDLVGIVAPKSERNLEFAKINRIRLFDSFTEANDEQSFDAGMISSPNEFHFDQTVELIQLKKPVFVEKPMTDTLEQAKQISDQSISTGIPVLVGHHRTYSTYMTAAKQFIDSSDFGRPVLLTGSALFFKPVEYFETGPWRKTLSGGPIKINLIHEIGIWRYLYGEIESVFAISSNAVRNFQVEDTVTISFKFVSGALGSFLLSDVAASSRSWEMTSGENPDYPHYKGESCYHISGTNGSIDFPNLETKTYDALTSPSWWSKFQCGKITVNPVDPLSAQIEHFIDVVSKKSTPRVSAEDGLENMLVLEAIRESSKTNVAIEMKNYRSKLFR